ncbi:hypothetical protein H9N28_14600 [Rhodobacter capsulatus]|uniref:hypothetical protein n=1 Tax=Rhodobacter capsulatus TaxID=1061 RepID=UPI000AB3E70A|nr:hypothetical protein [Rhodobacter capsulatus]QNR62761.1 hypothetical protein H9N28_14600 [Rhodobacter capsulatus]
MTEAETAYQAALEEIERVKREKRVELDLSGEALRALDRIPSALAELRWLQGIYLNQTAVRDLSPLAGLSALQGLRLEETAVFDLSPLAGMTGLQALWLEGTAVRNIDPLAGLNALLILQLSETAVSDLSPLAGITGLQALELARSAVVDLRPIRGLDKLGTGARPGLHFTNTPATRADAELARLSDIDDDAIRTRETLAYLNTLPPWPEPYLPKARPDGKPPEWIGQPPAPAIPVSAPAPLQVIEVDGVLRPAMLGDGLDTKNRLLAQQGWQALRDYLADLAELRPRIGNQMPTMDKALTRFEAGLGENFGQVNAIALGTHGNRIIRLAATAEDSLAAADAAELVEFAAAIALFLERLADWRAYREDALSHPPSAAEVQSALPPIEAIVDELFDRAEIDPEIGQNLKDQLAAVHEETGDALTAKGLIASTRNVLGRLAEVAWRGVKTVGKLSGETASFAANVLTILTTTRDALHTLATTLPEQFGWLEAVLKALKI